LRGESAEPICVYIDSNGGDIFFADLLTNLIRCPNQDGVRCQMITIASGFVGSCAADMLALGDYAIAYPFSQIHYHGTRQHDNEITLQKIPFLAASLRATNEQYAFRLAYRMFKRMVFHMMIFVSGKINPNSTQIKDLFAFYEDHKIGEFIAHLKVKLKDQPVLLNATLARQEKFRKLVASLRAGDNKTIDTKNQSELFKHLLDLEVKENPGQSIMEILPKVEEDFAQIRDFFFGMYQRNLQSIVQESCMVFLAPEELAQLQQEKSKGDKEAQVYILKTVSPRLEPLWFFVISLCRALQEGEFPMDPEHAYWAGLVDEINGANLPSMRATNEAFMSASNEQPQPA
jgi:hypothetical protein